MGGRHRKPVSVRPVVRAAAGASLAAVSLLAETVATSPSASVVKPVADQRSLGPVVFPWAAWTPSEAVLFLPALPSAPVVAAAPVVPVTRTVPAEPAVVVAPVTVKTPAPEHPVALAARAVAAAVSRKGDPYVWGGTAPGGFDCSGLVQWAYQQAGISLPRTAAAQAGVGHLVGMSALQPGDLLFYYSPIEHVAMFIGNGMIAEASTFGVPVHVRPMYTDGLVEARRIT